MKIDSHRDLIVWNKAIELTKEIYIITNKLPRSEVYNLSAQMRRSVISIPSNIAEGYKRKSLREYIRFLNIADGSAAELETQLIILKQLYTNIETSKAELLVAEVLKMLITLIKRLLPTA